MSNIMSYLSYILVIQSQQEVTNHLNAVKNKNAQAQKIIEKRRLMKDMSTDEIRNQLQRSGIRIQAYRTRDDLESALALVWMGELETPGDDSQDLRTEFVSAIGNWSSSLRSALGSSRWRNIVDDFVMTDAERTAREVVYSNISSSEISEYDLASAREALQSVDSFDEACELCNDYSKTMILKLLRDDFNIQADPSLTHVELVNILSDSVILSQRVQSKSRSPLTASFETVPSSSPRMPSSSIRNRTSERSPKAVRDSILFPEQDILPWLKSGLNRVAGEWRAVSASSGLSQLFDDKISAGIHNLLHTVSTVGVEAACSLAMWAAGSRSRVPGTLLVSCLVTMLARRGLLFFFEVLLAIRVVRVGLYGNCEGELSSSSDEVHRGKPGFRVQTVLMVAFVVWYLLQFSKSVRSFPTQKLFSRGIGFR